METPSDDIQEALHPGVREVFRDATLWVLDKPSGVLSHPNKPGMQAANILFRGTYDFERELYRLSLPGRPQLQVHLVHRLDLETSGLILCSFNADSAAFLKEAFFHREISKEYRALALGGPAAPRGEWSDRLEKSSEAGRAVVKVVRGKDNASTRFAVVERIEPAGLFLLSLWPETGRTHQLRVQAASRGCPIAGDQRYGDFAANRFLASEIGLKRMFLHAQRVELRHPATGHVLKLNAPLSTRLLETLTRARGLSAPVPRRE